MGTSMDRCARRHASGALWAHIGHKERCQRILDPVTKEDWGALALTQKGQRVRIVGR